MSDVAIPDGWMQVKLGDVCSIFSGFAFKSASWKTNGTPVIKITNVKRGQLILDSCGYVSPDSYPTDHKFWIQSQDVLIALTGYVGELAFIGEQHTKCLINQRVGCLRSKGDHVTRFLFYLLSTGELRSNILSLATGSAQSNVSPRSIESIPILLPPLHEQKAVAHILGTLDDKIDQLRKTNSVLEDMASALFKSWFVDFDPVKAKQENIPTGLPKDLDELFPDSFEDSALGPIPKGWRVAGLASTGEFLNGLALQKYPGDVLPVIKIPQLRQNSTEGADKCSDGIAPQYVIDDGDLLFSWSGTLVAGWWTAGKGALNQHLFKVSSGELSLVMLKHWIDHHLPWFRLVASSKAVTMGHIKRSHLDEAKVVIPAMALNDHAQTILADYRDKFIANGKHIRTLTNLRDTLLPKLISGDLRVPEAEQMVAELGL
jgi:type I restriction enzyme S subunit